MSFIKRNLFKIIFILFIIIIIGSLFIKKYLIDNQNSNSIKEEDAIELTKKDDSKDDEEVVVVSVDIKGAVKKPGVYEIENNRKVIDVVNMAGGFNDNADTSFVNLAKKVVDEMVVVIYTSEQIKEAKKRETISLEVNDTCVCPIIDNDSCINNNTNNSKNSNNNTSSNNNKSSNNNEGSNVLVNINTASLEELQTLSGIGEAKAQAIIDYRNEVGKFTKIKDITNVSGIGEAAFEKIKDNITV